MLNVSMAAETEEHEATLRIPFWCTEAFSESCLVHGTLPERNAESYQRLVSSMTHAFVSLLLSDESLDDYDDHGVLYGERFSFGVRDGVPYNHFPGAQR